MPTHILTHMLLFNPGAMCFDLNFFHDPDHGDRPLWNDKEPLIGQLVLIRPPERDGFLDNQIAWVVRHVGTVCEVLVSRHPHFGNMVHVNRKLIVPVSWLRIISKSMACLQDLRHAVTVGGQFQIQAPVLLAAYSMGITAENKVEWKIRRAWVDASRVAKTDKGICICAQYMVEKQLYDFQLDPARILCMCPFWGPAGEERDRTILSAALFFADASTDEMEKRVNMFDRHSCPPDEQYALLMRHATETLEEYMTIEYHAPPSPQPPSDLYPGVYAMPRSAMPKYQDMRLGWFTRSWINGSDRYDPEEKRQFEDIVSHILMLSLKDTTHMGEIRRLVDTTMLGDGGMPEFTRKMGDVYASLKTELDIKRKQPAQVKNAIDLLSAIMQEMTRQRVIMPELEDDPLYTDAPPKAAPEVYEWE